MLREERLNRRTELLEHLVFGNLRLLKEVLKMYWPTRKGVVHKCVMPFQSKVFNRLVPMLIVKSRKAEVVQAEAEKVEFFFIELKNVSFQVPMPVSTRER